MPASTFGVGTFGVATFGGAIGGGGITPLPSLPVVEVAFSTDPNSPTPVWTDISAWVMSFNTHRGRQEQLDRHEAGTATIVLNNIDRRFGSLNAASPYFPNVVPMRRIRISTAWAGITYRLFSGYVETWQPSYPTAFDSNVIVQAVDAFKVFALVELRATLTQALSGQRVNDILDAISWPAADRVISAGQTNIQFVTYATGSNVMALTHMQDVETAENGLLFINGAGQVVFVDRSSRVIMAQYKTSRGTFGDAAGELLYVDLTLDYSDSQIWNVISVTAAGGIEQRVSDAASMARYWPRTLTRSNGLMVSDLEANDAANWLLNKYKQPSLRALQLVLDGEADPGNTWPQIFGRELGERITVAKTPPGGGVRVVQESYIEEMTIDWQAAGGIWRADWRLSPADSTGFWILEDPASVLGVNTVLGA